MLSAEEIAELADGCLRFEQAAVQVPLLSIYEREETKVKTGIMTSRKILVGIRII